MCIQDHRSCLIEGLRAEKVGLLESYLSSEWHKWHPGIHSADLMFIKKDASISLPLDLIMGINRL